MRTHEPRSDAFDKLLDMYVEELNAMSDAQALAGADPATMEKEGLELLQRARDAAGRRRLTAARAELAQQKTALVAMEPEPNVTAQEARHFLAQAANDGRYTLAARELKDMSDHEAMRLYTQIKKLETRQTPPDEEA